jgi:hypothetical protein
MKKITFFQCFFPCFSFRKSQLFSLGIFHFLGYVSCAGENPEIVMTCLQGFEFLTIFLFVSDVQDKSEKSDHSTSFFNFLHVFLRLIRRM